MDPNVTVFRELTLWLFDSHEKPWDYRNDTALEIYSDHLQNVLLTFNDRRHLENSLPSEDSVCVEFPRRTFIYLDPVLKGSIMVPTMHLMCDFGRNHPEVRLRLGLFLLEEHALHSIGFRFESPEGQSREGRGMHHYYHSQLINDTGPQDACISWLPTSQPALPLDADDPIKLMLCILIGLYGLDYLGTLRNQSRIMGLDHYINDMLCHGSDPIEKYWMVTIGNAAKRQEFYRTSNEDEAFERTIRGRYQGCEIKGITKARYDALPERDRLVL